MLVSCSMHYNSIEHKILKTHLALVSKITFVNLFACFFVPLFVHSLIHCLFYEDTTLDFYFRCYVIIILQGP